MDYLYYFTLSEYKIYIFSLVTYNFNKIQKNFSSTDSISYKNNKCI